MDADNDGPLIIDEDSGEIMTRVGTTMRPVAFSLFAEVHADLADKYRAAGLTGAALDEAIVAAMPLVLASMLHGRSYH